MTPRRIAFLTDSLNVDQDNGALSNLIEALSDQNLVINLLLCEQTEHIAALAENRYELFLIGKTGKGKSTSGLMNYVKNFRPDFVISCCLKTTALALKVKKRNKSHRAFYISWLNESPLTSQPGESKLSRLKKIRKAKKILPNADLVLTDSQKILTDIEACISDEETPLHLLKPALLPLNFDDLCEREVSHPWPNDSEIPLILAIGELRHRNHFDKLIRSFATLQDTVPSRLIVVGSGTQRETLLDLSAQLSLEDRIDLLEKTPNLHALIRQSSALVSLSKKQFPLFPSAIAINSGIKIIALQTDEATEMLAGYNNAKLLKTNNIDEVAGEIKKALLEPETASGHLKNNRHNDYRAEEAASRLLEILDLYG